MAFRENMNLKSTRLYKTKIQLNEYTRQLYVELVEHGLKKGQEQEIRGLIMHIPSQII